MGPIQYVQPQQNVGNNVLQGLQAAQTIANLGAMGDRKEQAQMDAQKSSELKAQYSNDLQSAFDNPTPSAFAGLVAKYPGQKEALKESFGMLNKEQKLTEVRKTGQVYQALLNEKPDVALKFVDREIQALQNSGKDTKNLESIQEMIQSNPKMATGYVGMMLSSIQDPEKFISNYKTLEETKEVPQANILKKQELDIKKDNVAVRALEAKLRKEGNSLKKEELQLKIDERKQKIETKTEEISQGKKEQVAQAESSVANFDRIIGSLDKMLTHPGREKATGFSSFMSIVPGTEAKDFSALVDTFESQSFLAEIEKMKGLGALSESEGKKLSSAVANLDRSQSEGAFKSNLESAIKFFKKGRNTMMKKYGVSTKKDEVPKQEETKQQFGAPPAGAVRRLN